MPNAHCLEVPAAVASVNWNQFDNLLTRSRDIRIRVVMGPQLGLLC